MSILGSSKEILPYFSNLPSSKIAQPVTFEA
nr:MAG TPA: hypothetical protein [Caudoviricetes sp.]